MAHVRLPRRAVPCKPLFLDNLGGDADLLLDEQATHSAIADAFADLSHATVEDVVVIAFSGHGTPSHELAPHDAERRRPADTMISAEQLSRWVSAIPATNLLLVLDCCFFRRRRRQGHADGPHPAQPGLGPRSH